MNIFAISSANKYLHFGDFNWKKRNGETAKQTDLRIEQSLNNTEMNLVNDVIDRITEISEISNKNKRRIDLADITFDVKKSSRRRGHYLVVETQPTDEIMQVINNQIKHIYTPKEAYRRKYNIEIENDSVFSRDSFVDRVVNFIDKQIRWHKYCTKDPEHNSELVYGRRK